MIWLPLTLFAPPCGRAIAICQQRLSLTAWVGPVEVGQVIARIEVDDDSAGFVRAQPVLNRQKVVVGTAVWAADVDVCDLFVTSVEMRDEGLVLADT